MGKAKKLIAKKVIKLIKKINIILIVLILGLVMRLVKTNQSLWLDEAIGALAVRDFTYLGIVKDFMLVDNHPPLYYLILKTWTSIFGYSETSIRVPSIIFGMGTVYLVYLIADKVGKQNRFFPMLSAVFIATSQFHIYYSQEARMYAAAGFFTSCTFYFLIRSFESVSVPNWLAFSASQFFLIFCDYVPVFLLPVFLVIALIKKPDRKWWRAFLLAQIPLVVLGLLWFPAFQEQTENGKWLVTTWPAWKQVAGGATLKQLVLVWTKFTLGRISLSNKTIYYSLIGVSTLVFIIPFIKAFFAKCKTINFIWLWLTIPLVLGFLTSFWFPAFIYFRFVYLVPAFYILAAWGVSGYKNKKLKLILATLLLAVNVTSWLIYVFDEDQQREQWRQATTFVEGRASDDDVVIFEFPEPIAPYEWYSKGKVEARGVTDSISADGEETSRITLETVRNKEGVYYFEYLRELSDPEDSVRVTLKESGWIVADTFNFPGVGLIYYWRKV